MDCEGISKATQGVYGTVKMDLVFISLPFAIMCLFCQIFFGCDFDFVGMCMLF